MYKSNLNQGLRAWANAQELSSAGMFDFGSVADMNYQKALSNVFLALAEQYGYLKFGSQVMSKLTWAGLAVELKTDYDKISAAPPGFDTYVEATEDVGGTLVALLAGAYAGSRSGNILVAGAAAVTAASFWKGSVSYIANQLPVAGDENNFNNPKLNV